MDGEGEPAGDSVLGGSRTFCRTGVDDESAVVALVDGGQSAGLAGLFNLSRYLGKLLLFLEPVVDYLTKTLKLLKRLFFFHSLQLTLQGHTMRLQFLYIEH